MIIGIKGLRNIIKWKTNLQIAFAHKNKNRLKVKLDLPKTTSTESLDLKAAKNRENWEKQKELTSAIDGKICFDDVFFKNEYETLKYNLTDAITMHKEYCLEPSMLNAPYAILRANFIFNMRTKKSTKFSSKIAGIVVLPHELTFIDKKRIIAFCKTPEDINIALENGAIDAGDESLVKKIEQGMINYEEFDQAVCHTDAVALLNKIKPILKDKLPLRGGPRLGTDMKTLVHSYVNGYEYESRKIEGVSEEALLTVPLGEIGWPTESLEKNFLAFLTSFVVSSPPQLAGDLILKTTLACAPSDEILTLDVSDLVAHLKKEKATRSRKTKKEEEEVQEEETAEEEEA